MSESVSASFSSAFFKLRAKSFKASSWPYSTITLAPNHNPTFPVLLGIVAFDQILSPTKKFVSTYLSSLVDLLLSKATISNVFLMSGNLTLKFCLALSN